MNSDRIFTISKSKLFLMFIIILLLFIPLMWIVLGLWKYLILILLIIAGLFLIILFIEEKFPSSRIGKSITNFSEFILEILFNILMLSP